MAVSLPPPRGGDVTAARSHRSPPCQMRTCLPGQMAPLHRAVRATSLILPSPLCPSPAAPRCGAEGPPSPTEGCGGLLGPDGKGCPCRRVTECGHNGLWTGCEWPSLAGKGLFRRRVGRRLGRLPAPRHPTLHGGAVPRGCQREGSRSPVPAVPNWSDQQQDGRLAHLACCPHARDGGHVARLGKPPSERGVTCGDQAGTRHRTL